ncbi:MAG: pantoate kinase [Thermoplasmata archaeon]
MKVTYRSPGSITLFFYPSGDKKNILSYGSYGIGLVIDKFVYSTVEDSTDTEITIKGKEYNNTIQEKILDELKLKAKIDVRTDIDISQGFGTSAAGAISTAFALNRLFSLKMTYYETSSIAHRAEILNKSGLGDVASIITGGFTVRLKPGIPPYGFIDTLENGSNEFVYLILNSPIETKRVLQDNNKIKTIRKYGRIAMNEFLKEKTIENAFKISLWFSKNVGILDNELNDIINIARDYGNVTQIMIGNSLIAYGENDKIEKLFERYGKTGRIKIIKCGISRIY